MLKAGRKIGIETRQGLQQRLAPLGGSGMNQ
ncbi:hypothetical protein RS9917_12915 [Synechococcus sp. RS9917]|nr:hypothetical protein RS9917_12915 [Synechococcus sp. RS9917]